MTELAWRDFPERVHERFEDIPAAVEAVNAAFTEVVLELHVVPHGLNRLLSPLLRRMLAANEAEKAAPRWAPPPWW